MIVNLTSLNNYIFIDKLLIKLFTGIIVMLCLQELENKIESLNNEASTRRENSESLALTNEVRV